MLVAYIAGPYRADSHYGIHQNIASAEAVAMKYWRLGYAVICPHKNTAHFDGAMPDETWLKGDLEILKRCDVIVMMRGYKCSDGALAELKYARQHGLKIILDDGEI